MQQAEDPGRSGNTIELAELLELLSDWLEADCETLTVSLARFAGSPDYGP